MRGAGDLAEDRSLVTDNPITTHNRWLPLVCPNITVAIYLRNFIFRPDLDVWMVYTEDDLFAIPPPVPLENGSPSTFLLPPVERVILSPGTSSDWRSEFVTSVDCPPRVITPPEASADHPLLMWPATCFDTIHFGAHTLRFDHAPNSAAAPGASGGS